MNMEAEMTNSHKTFQSLIDAVVAHSEEFLIEPQLFGGAPQTITVWKYLRSEVYDHYPAHIDPIRAWLGNSQ
jgi:hypothetical protein